MVAECRRVTRERSARQRGPLANATIVGAEKPMGFLRSEHGFIPDPNPQYEV